MELYRQLQEDALLGGYQMLVKAENMRGKFRNSYKQPTVMVPDDRSSG